MSASAVRALAATLRVSMEADGVSGDTFEVRLTAPEGMCWEPGLHERVIATLNGCSPREVWRSALAVLRECVPEACTDSDCEWCGRDGGAS